MGERKPVPVKPMRAWAVVTRNGKIVGADGNTGLEVFTEKAWAEEMCFSRGKRVVCVRIVPESADE